MSKNHSRTVSIDTPNHSSRGRTPEGEPNPVDVYVGSRLRLRRTVLNLSQEKLVALAGLTFQQIQKYEHGMNRIGASRLYDFAQILDVPVSFFFAEMPEEVAQRSPRRYSGVSCCESDVPQLPEDPAHSAEIQSLIRAYSRITNREAARALLALSEKMAPPALIKKRIWPEKNVCPGRNRRFFYLCLKPLTGLEHDFRRLNAEQIEQQGQNVAGQFGQFQTSGRYRGIFFAHNRRGVVKAAECLRQRIGII